MFPRFSLRPPPTRRLMLLDNTHVSVAVHLRLVRPGTDPKRRGLKEKDFPSLLFTIRERTHGMVYEEY